MTTEKARFFSRLAARLKYPHLFLVVLALFGIDLAIPDAIPFMDEIILGFMTVLFGAWRRRLEQREEPAEKPPSLPPAQDDEPE